MSLTTPILSSNQENEIIDRNSKATSSENKELETIKQVLSSLENEEKTKFSVINPERIVTIEGKHSDIIRCITVSPDGAYLASGSDDKTRLIFDLKTLSVIDKYTGDGKFSSLLFTPDNRMLIGACYKSILCWEVSTKRLIKTLAGHDDEILCLSYNATESLIVSGSKDNTIRIWSMNSEIKILRGHSNWVSFAQYTSNMRTIISASFDRSIFFWDASQNQVIFKFPQFSNPIIGMALSKNEKMLAASDGIVIKVFNFKERKELFSIEIHKKIIRNLMFCRGDEIIISSSDDFTIKIINIARQSEEFTLSGHCEAVFSLWTNLEFDRIISGSKDKTIKIWDLKSKGSKTVLKTNNTLFSVSFCPQKNFLACAGESSSIYIYSLNEKKEIENYFFKNDEGHKMTITYLKFSKYGNFLVSCSADNSVILWDMDLRCIKSKYSNNTDPVMCACFDESENCILFAGFNGTIKIWKFSENLIIKSINVGSSIISIDFHESNNLFAVGTFEFNVLVYDYNCIEKPKTVLEGHTKSVSSVKFFKNSSCIASGSYDCLIKVWNINENNKEFTLSGHSKDIQSIALSLDEKFIASASEDFTVKVWNVNEKREEYTLMGHVMQVQSLTFIDNAKYLASASSDGTLGLWELESNDFNKIKSERYQNPPDFFNAYSSIGYKKYDRLTYQSLNIVISEYNFTVLHFLAHLGKLEIIENLAQNRTLSMRSDSFGFTPIHYSILQNHHKTTEFLLNQLCIIARESNKNMYVENFHAIRKDLVNIIRSSSVFLDDFLTECIYINKEIICLSSPKTNLPFALLYEKRYPDDSFFISGVGKNNHIPLVLKSFFYKLPYAIGSKSSLEFIKAINECNNLEIFRTDFIKYFAKVRWGKLWILIYINAIILCSNLVTVTFMLNDFNLKIAISVWSINGILLLWEIIQMSQIGFEYFLQIWNVIDIFRALLTISFPILTYCEIDIPFLAWIMVILNVLRGVTAFRAINSTRHYVRMIFESLINISSFLLIFIYSTLSFGLLRLSLLSTHNITFENIWANSFDLAVGEPDSMNLKEFNMFYFTFFIAVIFNLILMLNMIVSLLGDTFDEFQMMADIYNYKEMFDIILEMEYMISIFRIEDKESYLHICQAQGDSEKYAWKGKVLSFQMSLIRTEKNLEKLIKTTNERIKALEDATKKNEEVTVEEFGCIDKIELKINRILDLIKR
ncbi:hypothetical protein SteCoe_23286 [Stentor coeruleus]|uniref:Ion transport domain-containing protein n=1 Tax=Stentor coeruleus TaxID=5963 RepID=A0A1R2BK94_9CILI|nr:hypothetical protein SteCoe_23286 [Stentor coeruleus]